MADTEFIEVRSKSTGIVSWQPEHYLDHPVFGYDLERYDPEGYEEDKVVIEGHELPADQRSYVVAKPLEEYTVPELKEILKERGLDQGGNKDDLIARINDDNKDN
jgi:hypothetical protein